MLDESHPERFECVGSKGGDTDMVKLKLFGCVESFLEDEGWGETCWGEGAQRIEGERRLRWPEERTKCIIAVTPLLRRMVTNERQRRYAVETRGKERAKNGSQAGQEMGGSEAGGLNEGQRAEIDPKLGDFHYNIEPSFQNAIGTPDSSTVASQTPKSRIDSMKISVWAHKPGNEILNSTIIKFSAVPSYEELHQHIQKLVLNTSALDPYFDIEKGERTVSIHTPKDGLAVVRSAEEWDKRVKLIEDTQWMGNQLVVTVNQMYPVGTGACPY